MVSRVVDKVLADETMSRYVKALNPDFQKPTRPFMRMKYEDAIEWLNKQDPPILNEEGNPHAFGDDIAEAAERRMTDIINRPILLTHFPVEIKAFYMKKDPQDLRVTESVDVLSMSIFPNCFNRIEVGSARKGGKLLTFLLFPAVPGVGEIVGGSMRMDNYDELIEAYKKNGIPHEPYYWYTDQRKYVFP